MAQCRSHGVLGLTVMYGDISRSYRLDMPGHASLRHVDENGIQVDQPYLASSSRSRGFKPPSHYYLRHSLMLQHDRDH